MYIHLNGFLTPASEAHLSVDDRGFRYGDSVFETIRIHEGIPYLWEAHYDRLEQGLETLAIHADITDLHAHALALIQANTLKDGILRIQISRGSGSRGYLPAQTNSPTIVIETLALPNIPENKRIILCVSELRRIPPACLPTHLKIGQGLNSTLARMEAEEQGCYDAIQLSMDNFISECSSHTLFWSKGEHIFTPSPDTGCLKGITASQLFKHMPWKLSAGHYKLPHLLKADGVFICNSASLVLAVHNIQIRNHTFDFPKSTALAARCRVFFEQNMAAYALDCKHKEKKQVESYCV